MSIIFQQITNGALGMLGSMQEPGLQTEYIGWTWPTGGGFPPPSGTSQVYEFDMQIDEAFPNFGGSIVLYSGLDSSNDEFAITIGQPTLNNVTFIGDFAGQRYQLDNINENLIGSGVPFTLKVTRAFGNVQIQINGGSTLNVPFNMNNTLGAVNYEINAFTPFAPGEPNSKIFFNYLKQGTTDIVLNNVPQIPGFTIIT